MIAATSPLLQLMNVTVKIGGELVLDNLSFSIAKNQYWAITGSSGSGKTTLANVLLKKIFYSGTVAISFATDNKREILLVEQQHHFKNLSNVNDFYYQQRYNSMDAEDALTVLDYLQPYNSRGKENVLEGIIDQLHIRTLLAKPLIQLSNGENKRLQLAIALLQKPALLILDNPFTGLDTNGRLLLEQILAQFTRDGQAFIIITQATAIPPSITHVLVLEKGKAVFQGATHIFRESQPSSPTAVKKLDEGLLQQILPLRYYSFESVIRMHSVSVKLGNRVILDAINWEVKKGEQWSLSGPNGAGKSTLLSLLTGDNPQAYANEIYLFDRRRGSGESIWDIKRNIGFLSPELHLFFDRSSSCFDVIASGLFDTIGLFRLLQDEQAAQVDKLLRLFGLQAVRNKLLFQLPLGQQRMILLARAIIKNPPLLLLDEPCQGLDEEQSEQIKGLLDSICYNTERAMVYVSHYVKDIPSCVQQHLRLENGKTIG